MREPDDLEINEALAWHYKRIAAGRGINALRLAMKEEGINIGQGTLGRLSHGRDGARMASLNKLAKFARCEPESLLCMPGEGELHDSDTSKSERASSAVSVKEGLAVLATAINSVEDPDQRELVGQRLLTLARAPDSMKALQGVLESLEKNQDKEPEHHKSPRSIAAEVAEMKLTAESAQIFNQGITKDVVNNK